MMYRDRAHAAEVLAERLQGFEGKGTIVVGIPRGAVPMAAVIATALGADLDVVLVRKLGMPGHEEFALGAVDETGQVFLHADPRDYGVDEAALASVVARETERLARRRDAYTPLRPLLDPRGRTVIVVDDGAATGSTMVAAIASVRRHGAARVVAAVPVASVAAARLIRAHADKTIILAEPQAFRAVGEYYDRFDEIDDAAVIELLVARGEDP